MYVSKDIATKIVSYVSIHKSAKQLMKSLMCLHIIIAGTVVEKVLNCHMRKSKDALIENDSPSKILLE